jgi:hypothetical protein
LQQFAHHLGKSSATALQNMVSRTEDAVQHKKTALGMFLDIEGASDWTEL